MKHAHSCKNITPESLHNLHESAANITLIDVLPPGHFNNVHIPGAQNACVYEMTFLDQVHAISSESSRPLIVYGAGSNSLDSRTAAEKLFMAGYSDVSALEGGIERWGQAGYPLVGEAIASGSNTDLENRLDDGDYIIVPSLCRIGWTGRNPNNCHFGTVPVSGGNFHIDNSAIQGSIAVDMDGIDNLSLAGNELQKVLISHLKSDDFFFIDAFPAARLDIRSGRFNHEEYPTQPNCELTGTLDLRGLQNDLSFGATLAKGMDGYLHLSAHFDLDRTLWGITYGSSKFYKHLGMHTVFDDISIELIIVAEKLLENLS